MQAQAQNHKQRLRSTWEFARFFYLTFIAPWPPIRLPSARHGPRRLSIADHNRLRHPAADRRPDGGPRRGTGLHRRSCRAPCPVAGPARAGQAGRPLLADGAVPLLPRLLAERPCAQEVRSDVLPQGADDAAGMVRVPRVPRCPTAGAGAARGRVLYMDAAQLDPVLRQGLLHPGDDGRHIRSSLDGAAPVDRGRLCDRVVTRCARGQDRQRQLGQTPDQRRQEYMSRLLTETQACRRGASLWLGAAHCGLLAAPDGAATRRKDGDEAPKRKDRHPLDPDHDSHTGRRHADPDTPGRTQGPHHGGPWLPTST